MHARSTCVQRGAPRRPPARRPPAGAEAPASAYGWGGCRAAELVGMQPRVHAVCENSAPAMKILKHHWPEAITWHDVRDIGEEQARELANKAPALKCVVLTCGSPCQGVSGANTEAKLWADPRTRLLLEIPRIVKVFRACLPGVEVKCLTENVSSMARHGPEVIQMFNKRFRITN